jgi:hypothetical protein
VRLKVVEALAGCGKTPFAEERRPQGLKPALIPNALRGPEGPLFHGDSYICEFFSSLLAAPLSKWSK